MNSAKQTYNINKKKYKYYFEIIKIINNFNMGNTCSICVERTVDSFLNPCGHTACNICIEKMNNLNGCFICRMPIINTKKLYYI